MLYSKTKKQQQARQPNLILWNIYTNYHPHPPTTTLNYKSNIQQSNKKKKTKQNNNPEMENQIRFFNAGNLDRARHFSSACKPSKLCELNLSPILLLLRLPKVEYLCKWNTNTKMGSILFRYVCSNINLCLFFKSNVAVCCSHPNYKLVNRYRDEMEPKQKKSWTNCVNTKIRLLLDCPASWSLPVAIPTD